MTPGIVLAPITFLAVSFSALAQTNLPEHFQQVDWERHERQAVASLQEYLRIDTSNPPGNELAAAEFFHRLFEAEGIPSTVFRYAPGHANIYALLRGDGTRKPLVLLSHMDVVGADPKGWRVPPFSGQIVGGEIYGRGAVDMKAEGLLHAMVMVIAARQRLPLRRDLIFLATADEEADNTGSSWILENRAELVRDAEYLITEGGANLVQAGRETVYGIAVAEKGPFWIRVTATGRGGHGSVPIASSAPNRLVSAMSRILAWKTPIDLLPFVEQYFQRIASLEKEPRASQFRDIRRFIQDPRFARALSEDESFNYLLRDTISLTILRGGLQTNVIPDTASGELDVRLLPGHDPQAFLAQLRAVVADDRIQLEPLNRFRPPNSSPTTTELYRIIEEVIHRFNPEALVTPVLGSGYTESQMYRPLGIACYGLSPMELTPEVDATQHAANERVPVEQIRRGLRVLYEVVARAATE